VLLLCHLLAGLSLNASPQYRFDNWNTDSGLPQNSVYSILQTRDGYLWLTTLDGLVRYDGVRFTVFNSSNTPALNSNRCKTLFEDAKGQLWIGTEDGLTRYRDGAFNTYTTKDGLPHNLIYSIQPDTEDALLINTAGGVVRWKDEKLSPYAGAPPGLISAVVFLSPSTLWYAAAEGLRRFSNHVLTTYTKRDGLSSSNVAVIYEDRRGEVWIGTRDAGLNRFADGTFEVFSVKDGLPNNYIKAIYEDREGRIWVGTDGGLSLFQDGKFLSYGAAQGLSDDSVQSIFEDREGTLWVGTSNNGINRLTSRAITVYSERDGLLGDNVYPIYQDRAGQIWIGTMTGLNSFKDGKFTAHTERDGLKLTNVTALYEDREGRMWVGANFGVGWLKDGKFNDLTGRLGLADDYFSFPVILEDREGSLWFGTNRGLVKYQNGAVTKYSTKDGLASDEVRAILEDRQGRLWFGTTNGLTSLADGRFVSLTTADGLGSNLVRSLYEDADGVLWVGTYDGGLSRFKEGKFTRYTMREGLFNNGVFQILEDNRGNFWMSCNLGIYRVSRRQLNDFADGKIRAVSSTAYGKQDGMLNIECNGNRQPAGWKTTDARLWFPTQKGVVVIDPEAVPINPQPPPVLVESCLLDRTPVDLRRTLEIAPGEENLEIQYTGLSFIKPEQMRFKYRIEGVDKDWVEAGSRRTAYYSHLPPGTYTFEVMAANSDGVWSTNAASLRLRVHPPFWRTWWFLSLAAASVVALTFLAYQRRLRQLRRAHRTQEAFTRQLIGSQEAERKRIAAELHDSLGQSLAIIRNRAALGLENRDDPEQTVEQLDEISEAAAHAIAEVRDIAYNLRPYQLEQLGLTKTIVVMLKKAAASASPALRLSYDIDRIDGLFPPDLEINLYRIIQEGINNILKHSEATEATVTIKRSPQGLELIIQDNGKGFVPGASVDAHDPRQGGFGLSGINERARMLGGRPELRSVPGKGTTIRIQLDLGEGRNGE
jgi:ligand-binding sensor domain-containing protein/signal transduction histidine kinase